MVYAITHEALVENLCDECSIRDLPAEQQGDAAAAALCARMNVNQGAEFDPDDPLRAQAHDLGLTDKFAANSYVYTEEETKAAIDCAKSRKVGECPVKSLVRGTRDES